MVLLIGSKIHWSHSWIIRVIRTSHRICFRVGRLTTRLDTHLAGSSLEHLTAERLQANSSILIKRPPAEERKKISRRTLCKLIILTRIARIILSWRRVTRAAWLQSRQSKVRESLSSKCICVIRVVSSSRSIRNVASFINHHSKLSKTRRKIRLTRWLRLACGILLRQQRFNHWTYRSLTKTQKVCHR